MAFLLTHVRFSEPNHPYQKMANQAKETLRMLITEGLSDILDLVEELYGSREEPVIIGYTDTELLGPLKHDVSVKLPLQMKTFLAEVGATGYVQSVDDKLSELYGISSGSGDVSEGCKATWALSKIPLYVEFRYHFDEDDSKWPMHLHIDSVDRTDMIGSAKMVFKLLQQIREKWNGTLEAECVEAVVNLSIEDESKAEAVAMLKRITKDNRAKVATKRTSAKWADLLALRDDPLNNYPRWWERFQDLAVAANMGDADLSLFTNLAQLSESRYQKWCEKHKDSAGTKKKPKKKKKKKVKTFILGDEAADKPANGKETSHDPAEGSEQQRKLEDEQTPSNNGKDGSSSQGVPPAIAELLDNLPPPTPLRRSSSHRGFFGALLPSPRSVTPTPEMSSEDVEDMSDDEAMTESPNKVSTPRRPSGHEPSAYQDWAMDRMWIYYGDAGIDPNTYQPGVLPFRQPPPLLPDLTCLLRGKLPVFVRRARVTGKEPKLEYDEALNRVIVTPHTETMTDLRQLKIHVDWLPPWKLQEYQAVEMAGIMPWRHDRAILPCLFPDCMHQCKDNNLSTQLCLGCGPRSTVRYCSKEHQRMDLAGHWEECGHADSVIPHWVDIGSQPKRFERRYPAIDDVNFLRSMEKYRQRAYYIWNCGQYTMFHPDPRGPVVVVWPTIEMQSKYGPRVERCMNAAFYDEGLTSVIEHLYGLVRMALRLSGQWRPSTIELLNEQFDKEFDWDSGTARDEDPCECTWAGIHADPDQCTPACVDFRARFNIDRRRAGIRAILEKLESKSWLLRVWQRQHPTIRNWRCRLAGEGFSDTRIRNLDEERPLMGRLWDGFGDLETIDGWEDIY